MAKDSHFLTAREKPLVQRLGEKSMRMEPDTSVFYQSMEGNSLFPALRISEEGSIPLGIRKAMEVAVNGLWR